MSTVNVHASLKYPVVLTASILVTSCVGDTELGDKVYSGVGSEACLVAIVVSFHPCCLFLYEYFCR